MLGRYLFASQNQALTERLILVLCNEISSRKKEEIFIDKSLQTHQHESMPITQLNVCSVLFRHNMDQGTYWQPNTRILEEYIMNIRQLEIEEDSLSEKFFELQSNELVQERLIWQHLTRRKINEMNHIPDQDFSDWGDD